MDHDPVDDVRNLVGAPAGTLTAAVTGSISQRQVHDDGPEVERTDLRGGDRDDRERRAFERARHVELAMGVGQDLSDARTDEVCPISLAAGHEGSASSCVPVFARASSMSASGQNGTPERFAISPVGAGRRTL